MKRKITRILIWAVACIIVFTMVIVADCLVEGHFEPLFIGHGIGAGVGLIAGHIIVEIVTLIMRKGKIMNDMRICPVCEEEHPRGDMLHTKDCHGIPYRLVCHSCYEKLMAKGYDGELYDELDEQIEEEE